MESKIIGIVLLACAGLIFQYSYDDFVGSFFSPNIKLKTMIEKDITNFIEKEAPENKKNIHHVRLIYRSEDTYNFLKKHPPQFQTKKNGNIWLEIEFFDLPDKENPGFIAQTSFFDLKTQNKISEFGRTYYFKDFDKNINVPVIAISNKKTKTAEPIVKKQDLQ